MIRRKNNIFLDKTFKSATVFVADFLFKFDFQSIYEKNQKNGPVVCSTEIPQKTIVINSDIKDGVTASVFVEQQFKDSKKVVEVNLKKDNGIKIDSINCSPDLTQNPQFNLQTYCRTNNKVVMISKS